jgi:hypothetical protein
MNFYKSLLQINNTCFWECVRIRTRKPKYRVLDKKKINTKTQISLYILYFSSAYVRIYIYIYIYIYYTRIHDNNIIQYVGIICMQNIYV